ncbi:MAG: hypothetical protein HYT12_02880 [Candidatus Liptonbacteria bacterium]|nr:hypothetical protein [Candidatus Liptonbacteria bacterium]
MDFEKEAEKIFAIYDEIANARKALHFLTNPIMNSARAELGIVITALRTVLLILIRDFLLAYGEPNTVFF